MLSDRCGERVARRGGTVRRFGRLPGERRGSRLASVRCLAPVFPVIQPAVLGPDHEFGDAVEASVHQVVVEVPQEVAGEERALLAEQIVFAANGWALECIASRHGPGI